MRGHPGPPVSSPLPEVILTPVGECLLEGERRGVRSLVLCLSPAGWVTLGKSLSLSVSVREDTWVRILSGAKDRQLKRTEGNPRALLEGLHVGAATVEASVDVPPLPRDS